MILELFGFLVDPTDQFKSRQHRQFSRGFVWLITQIVGKVTPLSLLIFPVLILIYILSFWDFTSFKNVGVLSLLIWCGIETIFYFYCLILKRQFSPKTFYPGGDGIPKEKRLDFLHKYLEECDDPLSALVRWFPSHNEEDIGMECMEKWLSWAYLSKNFEDLNENEREECKSFVRKITEKYPKVGRTSARIRFNFMKLHFDKLVVQHKPFVAYVVISIIQKVFGGLISLLGFRHHTLPGNTPLTYWSYEPDCTNISTSKPKTPIFFVHGIGIGISMYYNVLQTLVDRDPERPIYILDLPHISLKIVNRVPTMEETLESIDVIFSRHNLTECSWLAHSYGTIVTSWVINSRPDYVCKISMVDPVCFALWEPDLIYNFLYRKPPGPIHRLCQFFVAQDLLVAYTLFRNFWWSQNILFTKDVNCDAVIYLSSHDYIIDSKRIQSYLMRSTAMNHNNADGSTSVGEGGQGKFDIVEMKGLAHGSFLNSSLYLEKIVSQV